MKEEVFTDKIKRLGLYESTLENMIDEIDSLRTELAKAQERVKELEAKNARLVEERRQDCIDFFYWWFNAPGTNTEQGYDEWIKHKAEQALKEET